MKIGIPARRRTSADKLQEARLASARRTPAWTEIEDDLIARDGGRVFVSVGSDAVFKPHPGAVWERASSSAIADQAPFHWYEKNDGELVFLELLPRTWARSSRGESVAAQGRRHDRVSPPSSSSRLSPPANESTTPRGPAEPWSGAATASNSSRGPAGSRFSSTTTPRSNSDESKNCSRCSGTTAPGSAAAPHSPTRQASSRPVGRERATADTKCSNATSGSAQHSSPRSRSSSQPNPSSHTPNWSRYAGARQRPATWRSPRPARSSIDLASDRYSESARKCRFAGTF